MTKKSVLIVWGGPEWHTPQRSAHVVGELLEERGFDVVVEAGTSALGDADLSRRDLIVPVISEGSIEAQHLKNLLGAIRRGTGIAGFHGLMCDTFRAETLYQFMTGGQFVVHPGGVVDYTVEVTKPDDPVMAGIKDFRYRSEQYYMHIDPGLDVLAVTRFNGSVYSEIDGVVMPVVWKRRFGRGHVFYSSLGHNAEEFDVLEMRTIFERGALWAARDQGSG